MVIDTLTQTADRYYSAIANFFSPGVIDKLIDTGKSNYLSEVLSESGLIDSIDIETSLREIFNYLFELISLKYRSEYVYKNIIANKVIRGEHFLDSSYMLTELDVGICKADVVILNGTSTVYEIKSEYDSLDRIDRQVSEYRKMFDKINIITCNAQALKLEKMLSDDIGLIILTPTDDFVIIKQAKSNKRNVLPKVIFDTLRRNEYLEIIKKHYKFIPEVPNTLIYRACQNLFCDLSPEIAHYEMVSVLSKRKETRRLREYLDAFPSSLRAYIIGHDLSKSQSKKLESLMETSLREVISDKRRGGKRVLPIF